VGNIPVSCTTCLLPPWSRVLLEKLTGSQLIREILRILWNPNVHYRVYKSPPPVPNLSQIIQSMSPIRFPEDASQYYPPITGWVLQAVSSPQVSSPKSRLHLSSPLYCSMPHPSHSSRFLHPNNVWWRVQIIKLFIIQFSPLPYYLVPLRPKYSPQHTIYKHPQPTFLPQCEWPIFTPIQSKKQNYIVVYLNLYIFWKANWKTKYFSPNNSKHSPNSICS